MKRVAVLRAEAKQLREMARAITDPALIAEILELAAELELRATALEARTPDGRV
jgi:hypothetical protein